MFGTKGPMIYGRQTPFQRRQTTNLCRWRDADGRRHTRRFDDEESARAFLGRSRDEQTGDAK
jgi:hypothetical protein